MWEYFRRYKYAQCLLCNKPFVYNGGSTYNGCTVRFVYRIFEYSFVLGMFNSLGFRIFVLALLDSDIVFASLKL